MKSTWKWLGRESRPTAEPQAPTGGITVKDFPESFTPRWQQIRQQLLDGTYRPAPVRRKAIAKPDGGTRELGIPNVLDRLIQAAIVLVLTPIFDPEFSESSFGYRPNRSAQDAAKQVQKIIRSGRRQCVDMDLSKFFDRVQHDVLMARLSRKVHDKRLLKLIGRYLRAGVMIDGLCQPSDEAKTDRQHEQEQRPENGRARVRRLRIPWLWWSDSRQPQEA